MSRHLTVKNILILLVTLSVVLFLFTGVTPVSAQPYVSISPLPGTGTVDLDSPSGPSEYFKALFKVFILVISVLSVIKLMLCGFKYMMSEAISSKEDAKKCIWAVIFGIFLILLSYLILQVINPNLTKLHFDTIKTNVAPGSTGGDSNQPPGGNQPPEEEQEIFGLCYGGSGGVGGDSTLRGGPFVDNPSSTASEQCAISAQQSLTAAQEQVNQFNEQKAADIERIQTQINNVNEQLRAVGDELDEHLALRNQPCNTVGGPPFFWTENFDPNNPKLFAELRHSYNTLEECQVAYNGGDLLGREVVLNNTLRDLINERTERENSEPPTVNPGDFNCYQCSSLNL